MIKNVIGENAGKVWKVLNENMESNIEELKKKTKLKNDEIYLALGWLSRENKIIFFEENSVIKICLTDNE